MAATIGPAEAWARIRMILGPERGYFALAIVYGAATSVLGLAVPLAVQVLVGTVANVAQAQLVVVVAVVLFGLLALSGLLVALQTHLMELFERRFYCRITSDIVMRNIYAKFSFFETINREDFVNRYFEIITIQKNVPKLLIGGVTLGLQTIVGFVVVSVYHPLFLVFSLVLSVLILLILRIWGVGAVRKSYALSVEKYRMAQRLEELARANGFFKSERSIHHALDVAEATTAGYVAEHTAYFRYRFSQILAMLVLFAVANALLLGLGGWLVIQGQLALGQLVAAELILSGVLVGLSRSGEYLDLYYETCAAAVKLSEFHAIPLERSTGRLSIPPGPAEIHFDRVAYGTGKHEYRLDFRVPAGATVLVATRSHTLQKLVVDLLLRHREPAAGCVEVGGFDLTDCSLHALRDRVMVLDSSGVLERTILGYLTLEDPTLTRAQVRDALERVRLAEIVDRLPQGLDTPLGPFGFPLSRTETLRLKLAALLLWKPSVLIVTEIFDSVSPDRRHIFEEILRHREMTTLCFSNRRDLNLFDEYVYLSWDRSHRFDSLSELRAYEAGVERDVAQSA